ncbi:VWA domain-containing protein [Psychromonas sp. RZ22]|uniref:vWA domain-containing protein n=1 Tax=Psychromonas algarum TaxID=2555643 RepID=UPI001068622B|nr:VWA domain-containing protein [Psychromonas sp. RZ22]TEW53311.1 VWA domain-containing protein [Psychromonas sp. RZ22]
MNFNDMFMGSLNTLEFLRPYWLLGILVVILLSLWRYQRSRKKTTNIIANHLSEHLVTLPETTKNNRLLLNSLAIIACIALSGPSIRSLNMPVYEIQKAQVIALDLSFSMYATDIKPNRLSQAKYKTIDLLKKWTEGDKALIAYAGDAFTISPLTKDSNAIINHIPHLSPELMPIRGSRPDLALQKAISLLKNAGYQQGHIVFVTDGFDKTSLNKMQNMVKDSNWIVSVLAIATPAGAAIKLPDGSLLKDQKDKIVIPKLDNNTLYPITSISDGLYKTFDVRGQDIQSLADYYQDKNKVKENNKDQRNSDNKQLIDDGYWIALLLVPLFLLLFRKGVFYALLLTLTLPLTAHKVEASIWKNDQQNAYQDFQQGQYKEASNAFKDLSWKAAALFKDKQYKKAEATYLDQQSIEPNNANNLYNLGNAQAMQQKYKEALQSFNQALKINPDFEQAQKNKAAVETLLKQQEQENKQQPPQDQKQDQQNDKQQQQSSDQQQNEQQEQQSSEQQQNEQQEQQSSEQQQNEQQEQQSSEQQQNEQQEQQSSEQNDKESKQADEQKIKAEQQTKEDEEATPAAATIEQQATNKEYEDLPIWLKNMPDDPSLLLRNKMQLEYRKRSANHPVSQQNNGEIW